jgi:HlyD family secretion protein
MMPTVTNNVVTFTVIISADNQDGSLLPGMTCAVHFVVERSENALAVQNAALRYRPSTLSQDRIDELLFYASLEHMTDDEQHTELAAREQQMIQTAGQTGNAIVRMLTGTAQNRMPPRPPPGQGRRTAVVMRNLWYIDSDGRLAVRQVQIGINNGSLTEIRGADDLEGKQVILRERI